MVQEPRRHEYPVLPGACRHVRRRGDSRRGVRHRRLSNRPQPSRMDAADLRRTPVASAHRGQRGHDDRASGTVQLSGHPRDRIASDQLRVRGRTGRRVHRSRRHPGKDRGRSHGRTRHPGGRRQAALRMVPRRQREDDHRADPVFRTQGRPLLGRARGHDPGRCHRSVVDDCPG